MGNLSLFFATSIFVMLIVVSVFFFLYYILKKSEKNLMLVSFLYLILAVYTLISYDNLSQILLPKTIYLLITKIEIFVHMLPLFFYSQIIRNVFIEFNNKIHSNMPTLVMILLLILGIFLNESAVSIIIILFDILFIITCVILLKTAFEAFSKKISYAVNIAVSIIVVILANIIDIILLIQGMKIRDMYYIVLFIGVMIISFTVFKILRNSYVNSRKIANELKNKNQEDDIKIAEYNEISREIANIAKTLISKFPLFREKSSDIKRNIQKAANDIEEKNAKITNSIDELKSMVKEIEKIKENSTKLGKDTFDVNAISKQERNNILLINENMNKLKSLAEEIKVKIIDFDKIYNNFEEVIDKIKQISTTTNFLISNSFIKNVKEGKYGNTYDDLLKEIDTLYESSEKLADETNNILRKIRKNMKTSIEIADKWSNCTLKGIDYSENALNAFGDVEKMLENIIRNTEGLKNILEYVSKSASNISSNFENINIAAESTNNWVKYIIEYTSNQDLKVQETIDAIYSVSENAMKLNEELD